MQISFPKYIWAPFSLGPLQTDDLLILIGGIAVFFFFTALGGMAIIALLFIAYRPIKQYQPRGVLRHILYRCGLTSIGDYPRGTTRKFRE